MQTAFVPDGRIGPVTPLNEWKGPPVSRGLSRNREQYPGICHSIRPNPVEIHPLDIRPGHSPRVPQSISPCSKPGPECTPSRSRSDYQIHWVPGPRLVPKSKRNPSTRVCSTQYRKLSSTI